MVTDDVATSVDDHYGYDDGDANADSSQGNLCLNDKTATTKNEFFSFFSIHFKFQSSGLFNNLSILPTKLTN